MIPEAGKIYYAWQTPRYGEMIWMWMTDDPDEKPIMGGYMDRYVSQGMPKNPYQWATAHTNETGNLPAPNRMNNQ